MGDEEVDDNPREPSHVGNFATRAEILQMYCFHLDGIRKPPGKPGDLLLCVSGGKIIPPNSTCLVTVAWPFLEKDQYEYGKKEGMAKLVEQTDQKGQLMNDGLTALEGGIHNPRQGQRVKACLTMLFRNNGATSLVGWDLKILLES